MIFKILAVGLCLLGFLPLHAQIDSQKVSISVQFGPSNHKFDDLADFLTNLSGNNLTKDQRLLNVSGHLSYRFSQDFQTSFVYSFDIGTMDLSNKQNVNYPQVTYLSNGFGLKLTGFIYNLSYYRMGVSPVIGYSFYSLSQSEGAIDILPNANSSGLSYGVSIDNEVEVLDHIFFLLTAGFDFKKSGTVQSNSTSYSFNSFNTFLKFGVNFYL